MTEEMDLRTYFQRMSAMGKFAMTEKRANGETMHWAPFGFKNVRVNDKSTIAPDPKTFPFAIMALQMRREGSTFREICEFMTRKGMVSKRGKPIQPNGLHKILKTFGRLVGESHAQAAFLTRAEIRQALSK
jgi:hypothetical protein